MNAVLRMNDVETRERLAKEGLILCKCSEFDDRKWLKFTPESFYEIHGVNEILVGEISYCTDLEGFIEFCKKNKIKK